MELSFKQTVRITAALLLIAAANQTILTGLYMAKLAPPTQLMWGLEGLLFVLLAAFAGSALAQTKSLTLGFSAIAFSGALNVVQVGVGLTLFDAFRESAGQVEALEPVATAIVGFSFMIYNAAKILLGLAAVVFGMAKLNGGSKALGGLTVAAGGVAMVANALVLIGGISGPVPSPIAGGSGVVATVLLALCLSAAFKDD